MLVRTKYLIALFLLIVLVRKAESQDLAQQLKQDSLIYTIENFHTEEGLPDIRIFDIKQDQRGLIWLTSESSLYKFNGFDFESVLDFGEVDYFPKYFYIDNNQNIWLTKETPISKRPYNEIEVDVRVFSIKEKALLSLEQYLQLEAQTVYIDFQSENGTLYFTHNKIQYSFDEKLKLNNTQSEGVRLIYEDEEIKIFNHNELTKIINNQSGESIAQLKGQIFMAKRFGDKIYFNNIQKSGKLHSFDLKTFHSADIPILILARKFDITQNGFLVTALDNHLEIYDLIKNESKAVKKSPSSKNYLFRSIAVDDNDNIWVGSHVGLFKIDISQNKFKRLINSTQLSTRGILHLEDQRICVQTYKGSYLVDVKKNTKEKINIPQHSVSAIEYKGRYYFERGAINIIEYDPKTKSTIGTFSIEPKIRNNLSYAILIKTDNGKILFQNDLALYEFIPEQGILKHIDILDQGVQFKNIQIINQEIVLSTTKGVIFLNNNLEVTNRSLSKYNFQYIHQDNQDSDVLWASTKRGLLKWNKKTNVQDLFQRKDGFNNLSLTSIQEDKEGRLWIPSFSGLHLFNKEDKNIRTFYKEDGINNNEFNNYSSLKLEDGRFLFGGIDGITIVNPTLFKTSTHNRGKEIEIYLCSQINSNTSKEVNITNEVLTTNSIVLEDKHFQTNLVFGHYSFLKSKSKLFKYKIENKNGFNKEDWKTSKTNNILIAKRPYGEYLLSVLILDNSGTILSPLKEIDIIMKKPFYKDILFVCMVFLLSTMILFFSADKQSEFYERQKKRLENEVEKRTHTIELQKEELQKINQTKDKLFSILAHDLKSPLISLENISMKIKYLLDKNEPERLLEIGQNIETKVAKLNIFLDNLLNWSLQQRGNIRYHPEFLDLSLLINEVISLYDEQSKDKNIRIISRVAPDNLCYADKNTAHAILRNIIANAIKYSYAHSKIQIDYTMEKDMSMIRIMDNGLGLDLKTLDQIISSKYVQSHRGTSGETGTGLGLIISKELVELNKGRLSFEKNSPTGTIVKIYLPYKKN